MSDADGEKKGLPKTGGLVIVGTPIGNQGDLSPRAREALSSADVIYCEDTRHSGRLLSSAGIEHKRLVSLHEHNEQQRIGGILAALRAGETVALISDAGMPTVSDPGARVVKAALEEGASVSAVPGPSAGVLALAMSGLIAERWRFEGFLARKGKHREELVGEIARASHPSILYESPHRVAETLRDLATAIESERTVVVARELTKLYEEVWRGSLADAVAHFAAVEPRGEYVIIVDGAKHAAGPAPDLDVSARALLEAGLNKKDVASALKVLLGASHRAAFDAALRAADATG